MNLARIQIWKKIFFTSCILGETLGKFPMKMQQISASKYFFIRKLSEFIGDCNYRISGHPWTKQHIIPRWNINKSTFMWRDSLIFPWDDGAKNSTGNIFQNTRYNLANTSEFMVLFNEVMGHHRQHLSALTRHGDVQALLKAVQNVDL